MRSPIVVAATLLVAGTLSFSPFAHASGVDPTRLSLPPGPGSIEGLGRPFVPSIASGTASYGIEVAAPPAAGGFGPKVSLDYDSGGGISDLGMGWRIGGVPSLRRRVEDGLPRFDASDTFEIDGFGVASRLVEVSPNVFRPEFEPGTFVRVERAPDGATWEVRAKSGITYRFGQDVEAEGSRVATYLLHEAIDLHGHRVSYDWDTSTGHGVLRAITWNDYGDDVRCAIAFAYEDRPDPHVLYAAGIKQTFAKRLTTIDVTYGGALVRRYAVTYGSDAHSRLASVTLIGRDGTTREPTLSLGYTAPSLAADGQVTTMATPPGRSPADANVEIADLDGDTLPDLLVAMAGQYRSYVNKDGVSWASGIDWGATQSPSISLGATGVQLADIDGDGAIDLVAKSGTADLRYFPGATATTFRAAVPIKTVPSFSFEDPDVKLADMDGDRRTDVVITTSAGLAIAYNLSGADWTEPALVGVVDPTQSLRFSDGGHTQLCDVNGDRVQDLCYLTSGSLVYWPGRGRGAFDVAQIASGVPSWDPSSPWELHDLDGDGWVDLVHVGVDEVDVALASGPARFETPKAIRGVPTRGPNAAIRYADMNGSGTIDIVWIDVSGDPAQAWRYLELFPNGRAGLLSRIDNGLGHVTSITYGTAAEDAAAGRAAGTPWTSRMNIGMPIVRRVQSDDGLGDPAIVVEYHYANGTWSPVERTFAGFAGGVDRELGDAYTPTLIAESTFDVGIADRTQRGLVLSSLTHDEGGHLFARSTSAYTTRAIDNGIDGTSVVYTFKSSEQRTEIEGTDESRARTALTEWDQDSFGNVVAERHWGEVAGNDKLAGNDEAITLRTFANNAQDWILGYLATEELQDARGTRVAMKRLFYDGADFTGLPLGQVARGDLARQEAWVGPDPNAFELEVATRYDSDGHALEADDARGGGHVFEWDLHDHTTLLSESVRLDARTLTDRADVDRAFGVLTGFTGYDGEVTRVTYDAFGRPLAIVRPGDSADKPTVIYTYVESAPLSRVLTDARVTSGENTLEHSETLVDGAGRTRGSLSRDGGRWVLAGVSLLNARGDARRMLRPRFVGQEDHDAPPLLVDGPGDDVWKDALGRTIRTRSQLGIETKSSYAPFVTSRWDGAQTDSTSPYEHTPVVEARDGLGRLVRSTRTLKGQQLSASYAYDAAGALLSKTDPEGNVSRYAYDGRGRRATIDDPDLGHHVFAYNATGNLVAHTSPDGVMARFAFDLAGRPLSDDWNGDGTPEVTRVYDTSSRDPSNLLYLGKLVSTSGPSGATEDEYDLRQRVVAVHYRIDGKTFDVGSTYDDRDREILHTYPDGSSIRLRYDERGQLTGYGKNAVSIDYDADQRELGRVLNTGVALSNRYDDDRRRIEQRATSSTGDVIQDLVYHFDAASNIVGVSDGRPALDATRDRSESYEYDNLYRLRGASGAWGTAQWSYSPSGNLLARTSTVAALNAGAYSYDARRPHVPLTAIGGRQLTFDARGRLVSDGDRTMTWNAGDELAHVTSGSGATVDSAFDGDGTRRVRVERAASGETHTTYFLDAWSEVRDGKLVRYLVHGGRRFAQLADGNGVPPAGAAALAWRGQDDGSSATSIPFGEIAPRISMACVALALLAALLARYRRHARIVVPAFACAVLALSCAHHEESAGFDGTIQVLSDADELLFDDSIGSATEQTSGNGARRSSFSAYPYGLPRLDTSLVTRRYANTPRDTGVGLDQMGARAYAPDLGIWLSGDPLALENPGATLGRSFASANPFAYADLSPVGMTDRNGRVAGVDDATAVAFAAFALASIAVYSVATSTSFRDNVRSAVNHASQTIDDIRERMRPTPASPPVVVPEPKPAPPITPGPPSPPLVPQALPGPTPPSVPSAPRTTPDSHVNVDDLPHVGVYGGPKAGQRFSAKDKETVRQQNKERNGGRCVDCGVQTVPAKKSEKGVTPPSDESQVDHVYPAARGGDGAPYNGAERCRACNRAKSDSVTGPAVQYGEPANDNSYGLQPTGKPPWR